MIDAEKAIAVAERAIHIGAGKEQLFTADEIQSIASMLHEAEKDAARYRWLRNCTTVESKKLVSDYGGWIVGLGVLDGMIDQAMKEKGDE